MQKKLITLLACLLVVIVGGVAVYLVLDQTKDSGDSYRKKIETAQKYVQEENWDEAIIAYLEAIEENGKDEDAYYTLAQIYIYRNRMSEAKELLLSGINLTGSQRLQGLYDEYFKNAASNMTEDSKKENNVTIELNTTLLKRIGTYAMEDYQKKYGSPVYDQAGDGCEVEHKNLKGILFSYFNTEDNQNVIDEESGKPKNNMMPGKAEAKDLTVLLPGISETRTVTKEDLEKLNVKKLTYEKDTLLAKNIVTFESNNCIVTIETDENEQICLGAWNEIVPKEIENSASEVMEVKGSLVSATTGSGIGNAVINVREKGDQTGTPIFSTETESDGGYTLEVEPGDYTAEIDKEDYIAEFIDFTVDKWGEPNISQFVISEKLGEGEIRIVLEWGEYPNDLDSHLIGTDDQGNRLHVCFSDKECACANLDVDDMTGFGPETVTITNGGAGEFTYYVYDYNHTGGLSQSGAVVKVYLPGRATPVVYEVPTDVEGYAWSVFGIRNGEIVEPIEPNTHYRG